MGRKAAPTVLVYVPAAWALYEVTDALRALHARRMMCVERCFVTDRWLAVDNSQRDRQVQVY